jgi:hypothetical protein
MVQSQYRSDARTFVGRFLYAKLDLEEFYKKRKNASSISTKGKKETWLKNYKGNQRKLSTSC